MFKRTATAFLSIALVSAMTLSPAVCYADTESDYNEIAAEVSSLEDDYQATAAEIAANNDKLTAEEAELDKWLRCAYKGCQASDVIDYILKADNLQDMLSAVEYATRISENIYESMTAINDTQKELNQAAKQKESQLEELRAKKDELAEQLAEERRQQAEQMKAAESATPLEIYILLRQEGMSEAGACAILGNMKAESGFSATAYNPAGSYGLCQWLGGRLTRLQSYCSSNGYSYSSVYGQVKYLVYELQTSYTSSWDAVSTDGDVYDKVYTFVVDFERPADPSGAVSTRSVTAQAYYDEFAGTAV